MFMLKNGQKLELMEKVKKYIYKNIDTLYQKSLGSKNASNDQFKKQKKIEDFTDNLMIMAEKIV